MNYTEAKLAVFESFTSGEITEREKNILMKSIDEEYLTEGANIDNARLFSDAKTKIKAAVALYKKHLRAHQFSDAKRDLSLAKNELDKTEKLIRNSDGGAASLIFGLYAPTSKEISEVLINVGLFITIIGAPFAVVLSMAQQTIRFLQHVIFVVNTIDEKVREKDSFDLDDFNRYRNELLIQIGNMKRSIDKYSKTIDKLESEYNDKEKEDADVEESVNTLRLQIYEAVENGVISEHEKDLCLENLE